MQYFEIAIGQSSKGIQPRAEKVSDFEAWYQRMNPFSLKVHCMLTWCIMSHLTGSEDICRPVVAVTGAREI